MSIDFLFLIFNNPLFAFAPAIIFLFIYFKLRIKVLILIALLWALYPAYELWVLKTCGPIEICNIRADLIFIIPFLYILTAVGAILIIFKIWRKYKAK